MSMDLQTIWQVLGSESDLHYANRAVMFLYTLQVVSNGRRPTNMVGRFGINLIRAFGAIGFALPLILGALPSDLFRGVDEYFYLVAAAMLVESIPYEAFLPDFLITVLEKSIQVSYAIVKGNACAMGFVALQGIAPHSIIAPLLGAYVAVNGDRIIENGVQSLSGKGSNDADAKLAICGGLLYHACVTGMHGSFYGFTLLTSRVCLVLFRISCEYVDYDGFRKQIVGRAYNAFERSTVRMTSKSSGKRSNSRRKRA